MLVDQPTSRTTRKVNAATMGAAIGAIISRGAAEVSDMSRWLSWLSEVEVQFVVFTFAAAAGARAFGYFFKERAVVEFQEPDGMSERGA